MLKKLRLWWFGRSIPQVMVIEDGGFTIHYPIDGVLQRVGRVWARLKFLRTPAAFVAGAVTTALATVTVEHLFR